MSSPTPPPVDPGAPPVSSAAPGPTGMEEEVRQLARALGVKKESGLSARKAIVEAISAGSSSVAPTISVDLDGVIVQGVRLAASYSPQVGDTVLLLRQGNQFFAAFKIATAGSLVQNAARGGFMQASLNSGHSHDANNNGIAMYRRVMDHGAWRIDWKGSVNLGGSTTIMSGGNALPAEFRPSSRRTMTVARNAVDTTSVKVDFNTDGSVTVVGGTTSPTGSSTSVTLFSAGSHTHGGTFNANLPGTENDHGHGIPADGTHGHGSHSHTVYNTVLAPEYVVLNGISYYL